MPFADEYGSQSVEQARRRWVVSFLLAVGPVAFLLTSPLWATRSPRWWFFALAVTIGVHLAAPALLYWLWKPEKHVSQGTPEQSRRARPTIPETILAGAVVLALVLAGAKAVLTRSLPLWTKPVIVSMVLVIGASLSNYLFEQKGSNASRRQRAKTAVLAGIRSNVDYLIRLVRGVTLTPVVFVGTLLVELLSVRVRTALNSIAFLSFVIGIVLEFAATFC